MKNTKLLFFALLAAAALLFAAGCSDGDEESGIVGTWEYSGTYDSNSFTHTYVFNSDGTWSYTYSYNGSDDDPTTGTWSLDGSTLTITMIGSESDADGSYTYRREDVYTVAFSGNNMTLTPISVTVTTNGKTETMGADGSVMTFTRVS